MKIPATDPRWSGVSGDYLSSLPPPGVNNGQLVPLFATLSQSGCVSAVIRDGAQLGARIGRVVAATTGWPQPRIAKLDLLAASAAAIIPQGQVEDALRAGVTFGAKIIVGEALAALDSALSAITGIPILGWIVGIGRAVWQIVDAARARAPTIAGQHALAYDLLADSSAARHVLDLAAGSDWTQIFMPPAGPWGRERLAYTASGYADGDAWGQISGIDLGSIGALPGVAEIAGYWQSPRHLLGSSRLAGRESIQSAATLLPSTTSLCGQLWCAAQAGGLATTGRIDFAKLASAWRDYAGALQQFAGETRGGGDATKPQASPEHGWLADQIVRAFSWRIAGMEPFYGLDPKKVPSEYRIGLLDKIVAWRCAQAIEATRRAWRTTPSAAYVDASAPALKDPGLKLAWGKARQQLLHMARRRIGLDLSLVPQGEYRNALAPLPIPAGAGSSTGGAAPIGTAEEPDAPGGGGGSSSGGGALIVGALAAAAIGGVAILRR
jgi:hypothetical protein